MCYWKPGISVFHGKRYGVFDPTVSAWLECMARACRVQAEFLVGPLLAMTSVLIGPQTVLQATQFFKEPANIFTLTLCGTGAAKSAAYKTGLHPQRPDAPFGTA